jgi:hypothetical protein
VTRLIEQEDGPRVEQQLQAAAEQTPEGQGPHQQSDRDENAKDGAYRCDSS